MRVGLQNVAETRAMPHQDTTSVAIAGNQSEIKRTKTGEKPGALAWCDSAELGVSNPSSSRVGVAGPCRVCVKTGGSAAPLCGRAQPFRAEDSMSIDKQRFCRRAGKPEAFRTAGRRSRTNRELPVFTQALVAPRFSPALVFNEVPT